MKVELWSPKYGGPIPGLTLKPESYEESLLLNALYRDWYGQKLCAPSMIKGQDHNRPFLSLMIHPMDPPPKDKCFE